LKIERIDFEGMRATEGRRATDKLIPHKLQGMTLVGKELDAKCAIMQCKLFIPICHLD
jgi:hypothetical protein